MVRLVCNGKIIPKRFNSADEARNWFKKNKDRYGDKAVAGLVSELSYKKGWISK